jgi:hypothetical protein
VKYRIATLAIYCALVAGCDKPPPNTLARCQYDQDIRRDIFMECLRVVPQGPAATKYNDWSEVVNECGDQAGYMSLRGCSDTRYRGAPQESKP